MKTHALRLTRPLALAFGATGLLALASCMDRDPAGPSIAGPQLVAWSPSEPCSATGSAIIDGILNEPVWFDACTSEFIADLPGANTTHVVARFMDDGNKAYFSAISDHPFSAPNDVIRIFLKKDGAIHAIGFLGGSASQWTCTDLDTCEPATAAPTGATGVRRNFSGGTTYELEWPLASLLGGLEAEDIVDVRWETIPGGSAVRTLYPAPEDEPLQLQISGEGVGDNDPSLPDIVITTTAAVTVTIRDPDRDPVEDPTAFQCKIAQQEGADYIARFNDLEPETRWVGTAGNKKTCNHFIWPPLDPDFEPDLDIPGAQGAVYDEGETVSLPLTWGNWLLARGNAIPLEVIGGVGEVREWFIEFQGPGRRATCTVHGDGKTVYAIEPGDRPGIPFSPDQPPPGLGLTYAPNNAGECSLTGLSNELLVLQTRNSDGGESTGILSPGEESTTLFQQSALQGSTLLVDDVGDGSPVDLRTLIYGPVENSEGELTGDFSILATFDGWNARKKEAQVFFEVVIDRGLIGEQTIQVTAFYGTKKGVTGWHLDVHPDHQKDRVSLGSAFFAALAGGVEILIHEWSDVTTAEIRVRANLAGGSIDDMPNFGYAAWPGESGGSFNIRF